MSEIDKNNPIYLKEQIKYLYELISCPDVRITKIPNGTHTRIRIELILPNGEIIAEEKHIICYHLKNAELLNHIEKQMLTEIGFNYLKRALDERKKDNSKITANKFSSLLKEIIESEE